ncbi:MAG: branched-chain amino acid ABC transporter permease [Candidatus Dormibacteria bacterium]
MPKLTWPRGADGRASGATGSVVRRVSKPASAAAILVPVVGFAVANIFYPNQQELVMMMVYVVMAQGINVMYGFTGYLPFGYFGFFGVGAYGLSLSVIYLHVPAEVGLLLAIVAAVVVAAIMSPLLRLEGVYFAIASLAAAYAIYVVISNPALTPITKGPYGINLIVIYNSTASFIAALALVGMAMAVVVYLRMSRFGLALRAIRSDPVSAEYAGIMVVQERARAWLISAALAGAAGGVFAWYTSTFYPSAVFDISVSIFAIVFALFGGVGTVWGPALGAVLLFGIYNTVGISQPQYFQLIYGILIVLLVLFLPGGLAGLAQTLVAGSKRLRSGRDKITNLPVQPGTGDG